MKFYFGENCLDSDKYLFFNGQNGFDFLSFKPKKSTFKLKIDSTLLTNILIEQFVKEIVLSISLKSSSIILDHGEKLFTVSPYSFSFISSKNWVEIDAFFEKYEEESPKDNGINVNTLRTYTLHDKNFPEWQRLTDFTYKRNIIDIRNHLGTESYAYDNSEFYFTLDKVSDEMLSKAGLFEMQDIEWGWNNIKFKRDGNFYLDDNRLMGTGAKLFLIEEEDRIELS